MRDRAGKSTYFLGPQGDSLPCAGVFAPAGMLLVVILGVLPLMLPANTAGGAVPAVAHPEPNRILHLRQADLTHTSDGVPIAPPSEGTSPTPAAGAVVLRRARVGVPIQAPPAAGIQSAGRRLRLQWPSRGTITSPFGWRTHPIFGTREFHTGIDIAGQSGTPVSAAIPGTVRFVGWKAGYGQQVILYHGGGLETAYSHLSAASVQLGAHVAQGQEIGRVGNTGWSTGPHLLFEVFENGMPHDPTGYLN